MRIALVLLLASTGCKQVRNVNIFSVDDDIELGQQVRDEINNSPDYNVVDRANAPDAYGHLERIRDEILQTGDLKYGDRFEWEVYLIDDDETLNAFCAPGGYIWVYSGLMRYLDEEDHFAGVMGHEMAHADRRHTTDQLTKQYGITKLLEAALGDDSQTAQQVAAGLAGLQFSRADEAEADEYSVRYLCDTKYAANGAAAFFEKLEAEGGTNIPEFLSTHPSSESRVEDINQWAQDLGCSTDLAGDTDWPAVLSTLP